ncbi:uncharacterized protein J4E87_000386 [Alternaria ethzedia]|uniref:uncharacterized protein n=1 Tax=Alternaria ethzedia TaxID=181014 RepID=UPI0020C54F25|nr:uncharacterized protein J4E87_000386 [Alternaria ethzedia]KAI4635435.1 hypothetical protein J4E87_000386 [Alternaria ethzedia]
MGLTENRYIKEGRELCAALKHADTEASERLVQLNNNWVRFGSQLNFFQRIQNAMQEEHREVYSQTLQILQNKLDIVVSILRSFIKLQPANENGTAPPNLKVQRLKFAAKKSSLDEAIDDLEKWQGLADQSWFLLLRIANTQVDQALTTSGSHNELSTGVAMPETMAIRAGLQQVDDLSPDTSAVKNITLRSSDIKTMTVQAISFCDGIALATKAHSDGSASRYILNHMQCEPGAKPQILKRNVRDLVRKLQADKPHSFGLLKCKGFVAESVQVGLGENLSLTMVFREPPASQNPRSLREMLLASSTCVSTTRRLHIARDLARSIGYVHTFGFVHKNVRPESVLVFDDADGQGISAFLVGFENFRRDEGWTQRRGDDAPDKNLYRHASRQGFNPRDDYEMRHDIYSLGVCLLEIGLWSSFVEYDPATSARSLSQQLTTPSGKDREIASTSLRDPTKDVFIALARYRLPGSMGDMYAEVVETCLTCLDRGNLAFGDEEAFEDEDGIRVGARYIEKVLIRLGRLNM